MPDKIAVNIRNVDAAEWRKFIGTAEKCGLTAAKMFSVLMAHAEEGGLGEKLEKLERARKSLLGLGEEED